MVMKILQENKDFPWPLFTAGQTAQYVPSRRDARRCHSAGAAETARRDDHHVGPFV